MGDTNKNSLSEMQKRLNEIEKRQILGSLDKVFLLLLPVTLFVMSLIIVASRDYFGATMPLMLFLGVLILPLVIYINGIWNDSITHRLNAWLFFILYLFFFLFAIFPGSVYSEASAHKPAVSIASMLFIPGGFFLSINIFSRLFATKILSRFEKLEPSLERVSIFYKRFHIYTRKFLAISLMFWILAHIISLLLIS